MLFRRFAITVEKCTNLVPKLLESGNVEFIRRVAVVLYLCYNLTEIAEDWESINPIYNEVAPARRATLKILIKHKSRNLRDKIIQPFYKLTYKLRLLGDPTAVSYFASE
jgi:hypothetical protein